MRFSDFFFPYAVHLEPFIFPVNPACPVKLNLFHRGQSCLIQSFQASQPSSLPALNPILSILPAQ
jgi:hypothetical protein